VLCPLLHRCPIRLWQFIARVFNNSTHFRFGHMKLVLIVWIQRVLQHLFFIWNQQTLAHDQNLNPLVLIMIVSCRYYRRVRCGCKCNTGYRIQRHTLDSLDFTNNWISILRQRSLWLFVYIRCGWRWLLFGKTWLNLEWRQRKGQVKHDLIQTPDHTNFRMALDLNRSKVDLIVPITLKCDCVMAMLMIF